MSPYSGVMYEDSGGITDQPLENRASYQAIKSEIMPKYFDMMLYSKNPATRLTAIEYYVQHKQLFAKHKARIEKRINVIYKALPMVTTMKGCTVLTDSAFSLVRFYSTKR